MRCRPSAVPPLRQKALRECDIVARYGGEEFVIFLPGVDAEQAYSVAERLRETISELKVPSDDGRIVQFTISIGISSSKVSDNIDTLIKTADEALYKAKQNGRNRVEIFTPEDLKNFKPEEELPHKDKTQNRHPIFEKEENVEISLLDGNDNTVLSYEQKIGVTEKKSISDISLWSPDSPVLYTLCVRLLCEAREVDAY